MEIDLTVCVPINKEEQKITIEDLAKQIESASAHVLGWEEAEYRKAMDFAKGKKYKVKAKEKEENGKESGNCGKRKTDSSNT